MQMNLHTKMLIGGIVGGIMLASLHPIAGIAEVIPAESEYYKELNIKLQNQIKIMEESNVSDHIKEFNKLKEMFETVDLDKIDPNLKYYYDNNVANMITEH